MYRTAFKNISFCARDLLLHRLSHNPNHLLPLFSSSSHSIAPRFFSSTDSFSNQVTSSHRPHNTEKDDPSRAEDVISNEELKKRISKLEEGDTEAIPDILEGILSRMLAGKQAHNELRKELLGERTESDEEETESADDDSEDLDLEFDLDEDEMGGTNEE